MGRAAKKKKNEPKKNEPEPPKHSGKAATAKVKAKRKFPDLEKLFAPYQDNLDDLEVFWFDVLGGVRKYKIMMRLRKKRQLRLAPVLLGDNKVPVTPCANPCSGPSHHILRLTNSNAPGFMVDLLIRDTDLYISAFRRHILTDAELKLSEEERKALKIKPTGNWYAFSDIIMNDMMPKFIKNFSSMGISSTHGNKTSIGGDIAFNEMFYSMALFEDNATDVDALERAMANAIIAFCEASRFKSIYHLIISRMGDWTTVGSDLEEKTWKRIHGWHVLGSLWLVCRLDGMIDEGKTLSKNYVSYKFDPMTMGSLMDELLLVKFEADQLIDFGKLWDSQTKKGAGKDIEDPKLEADEEEKTAEEVDAEEAAAAAVAMEE